MNTSIHIQYNIYYQEQHFLCYDYYQSIPASLAQYADIICKQMQTFHRFVWWHPFLFLDSFIGQNGKLNDAIHVK